MIGGPASSRAVESSHVHQTEGLEFSLSSTLPSDPSSEKMQNTQLDLEYISQASNDESMNSFKRHGRAILTVAQVQAIFRFAGHDTGQGRRSQLALKLY